MMFCQNYTTMTSENIAKILKKYVLNMHLIHRFSWYSQEVDVGHLGADFTLGFSFSLERQM